MRGYTTINQFIMDYKFYRIATKIDPGKEGETITGILKKRMKVRLEKASRSFKERISKRKYSLNDLRIIATHDTIIHLVSIDYFIKECFRVQFMRPNHIKQLLKSSAFKSGRLRRIYEFIPSKVETKNEFLRFLRLRRAISKSELSMIMEHVCEKDWHVWLHELIDLNKIHEDNGRWLM